MLNTFNFIFVIGASLFFETAFAQMSEAPSSQSYYRSEYRSKSSSRRSSSRSPSSARSIRSSSNRSDDVGGASDSGFVFSVFYSTANEGQYSGQTTVTGQTSSYTATESTSAAPGLSAAYKYSILAGFGVLGGVAFELPRQSNGISGTAGNLKITGQYEKPTSTSLISGVANATYTLIPWVRFHAGLNFPVVIANTSTNLKGLPGYQIGVGSQITERLGAHLEYRVLRMKGQVSVPGLSLSIDELRFPGFILSLDYAI